MPDEEGCTLDVVDHKIYVVASLGFKVLNYEVIMAGHHLFLWEHLLKFIALFPKDKWALSNVLQTEAVWPSKQMLGDIPWMLLRVPWELQLYFSDMLGFSQLPYQIKQNLKLRTCLFYEDRWDSDHYKKKGNGKVIREYSPELFFIKAVPVWWHYWHSYQRDYRYMPNQVISILPISSRALNTDAISARGLTGLMPQHSWSIFQNLSMYRRCTFGDRLVPFIEAWFTTGTWVLSKVCFG